MGRIGRHGIIAHKKRGQTKSTVSLNTKDTRRIIELLHRNLQEVFGEADATRRRSRSWLPF